MAGLGAGARSYTREVHYCTEYAVGRSGIMDIISDYIGRSDVQHSSAVYGCRLSGEEQRRRYVIKSLLRVPGLSASDYEAWCGGDCRADFPQLAGLEETGLAIWSDGTLTLTDAGFERADTIGPWLYSADVEEEMRHYAFR